MKKPVLDFKDCEAEIATTTRHEKLEYSGCDRNRRLSPNAANVGGLQIQGVKGEVVVLYFEPLTTQKLKSSDVPEG